MTTPANETDEALGRPSDPRMAGKVAVVTGAGGAARTMR